MDIRFDNKVIVISGGLTGIGAATVKAFAGSGGKVIFIDVAKEVSEVDLIECGAVEYQKVDVTNEHEVELFANYIEKTYGGVDVLFNNAGILRNGKLHECSVSDWDKVMAVNVKGVFLCSKYFLPQMMKKNKGAIINTSSISGLFGDNAIAAYDASKGAVANLTRSMAIDYAPYNIRVNAINPGSIDTPLYRSTANIVGGLDVLTLGTKDVYPLGRPGTIDEVAGCVLFLASDVAGFITGHNLVIDGGLTAHSGCQTRWDRIVKEVAEMKKV